MAGPVRNTVKIAFVNQPQDPIEAGEEQRGSVAIVNWELARRLSERHEVVVYAPLGPRQPICERWERIELRRVRFVATSLHKIVQLLNGRFSREPYFASALYFREYYWQIARDLSEHPADIIHLPQQLQFAPLFRAACPNAKLVVHMHQDELAQLEHSRLSGQLAQLDAVVTVSDYVTDRARARFPALAARIHTIGNGVDVDRFRPEQARSAGARLPRRILYVGRISPDKGVHLLMEAFDRLAREWPDLNLSLIGKAGLLPFGLLNLLLSEDRPAAEHVRQFYGKSLSDWLTKEVLGQRSSYPNALLARLSATVRSRVHFLGTVPLQRLLQEYRQADVLVLPSIWHESYGLPVAEAMASGVPVIACRCGGVPELVDDGVTGRLVPRMDVEALFSAMHELLSDPQRLTTMGRYARTRAQELLTWKRSAERLERVYLSLVGAPAALTNGAAGAAVRAYRPVR